MIPALAVLIYLGSWQWQRYGEKQNAEQGIGLTETFALSVTPLDAPPQFIYSTYDGDAVWRGFQAMTGCLTDEAGEDVCSDAPLFVDLGLISGTEPSERLWRSRRAQRKSKSLVVIERCRMVAGPCLRQRTFPNATCGMQARR